ncbi:dynamin family protein [uncultured Planococcus sp.]|uniref:dynamin family protein n=1 Tax=uncultured Planococcus sp. TaxID=337815 RepID=UPI002613B69B|nr:dynamin family protein [uncultured Planococcus sp.]
MTLTLMSQERTIDIFNRYLGNKDPVTNLSYIETLQHKVKNSTHAEFYIPVLGIQGTGKSSFLNALLMDDLILPVDADETTCVPVEIRYGKKDTAFIVNFDDQAPLSIKNPKDLEQYIHNTYNPGNEKKVSFIQAFKEHPLLENGVVFVDLPGVGSLTTGNVKTTLKYIQKLSAAIFMLRTVPPITRQEAAFIKSVWSKLSKAWFIQNQWNEESITEVQDGKEHNINVLEKIRDANQTSDPIDLRVINVYEALNGQLQNNDEMKEKAGMTDFVQFLQSVTNSWSIMLEDEITHLQGQAYKDITDVLLREITLYKKGPAEHYEQLRVEEEKLNNVIEENNRILRSIEDFLTEKQVEIHYKLRNEVTRGKKNLRTDMQRIVKSDVVDGDNLTRAFKECQEDVANTIVEVFIESLTDTKIELEQLSNQLIMRNPNGSFSSYEEFSKTASFKFEKALPNVLSVGGGFAAAAALTFLVSNPAGWVVSGVFIVGGLIGNFLGSATKKLTQESRQRSTLNQLEQSIDEFTKTLEHSLSKQVDDFIMSVRSSAQKVKEEQVALQEVEYDKQRKIRFVEIEEYNKQLQQLQDDLQYIQSLRSIK